MLKRNKLTMHMFIKYSSLTKYINKNSQIKGRNTNVVLETLTVQSYFKITIAYSLGECQK